jgi:hypothetical protein
MEEFQRQFVNEHFPKLTPEDREDVIKSLPPEERPAGLTEEQIRQTQNSVKRWQPLENRPNALHTTRTLRTMDQSKTRFWS